MRHLFYYYRGPSKNNGSLKYDNQIEDNTTKSLINLLELLDDTGFTHLREALFEKLKLKKAQPIFYKLQYSAGSSRPDILIQFPGYKIIFEVKVKAGLNDQQIKNHLLGLEPQDKLIILTNNKKDEERVEELNDKRLIYISWADIHAMCRDMIKKYQSSKTKVHIDFINQFVEYLEVIVMTEFAGFRNEDFDFFLDYNKDYARILKRKLKMLADAIKSQLPPELKYYSEIKTGKIHQATGYYTKAWVAIKKPEDKKDITNQCNFTVDISSAELSINAVIRNGRIKDKRKPLGIFYKALGDELKFMKIIKKIGSSCFSVGHFISL